VVPAFSVELVANAPDESQRIVVAKRVEINFMAIWYFQTLAGPAIFYGIRLVHI